MARAKGFQGIVGRKKGSTWGTAVVPASSDGLYVVNLSSPFNTARIENRQISGKATTRAPIAGAREGTVSFETQLRYEGNEVDIALGLGTAGAPSTVDTSGKQHVLKPKDDVDGIFATLAYELLKDTQVVEISSYKTTKLTLSAEAKGEVMLKVEGIGHDWSDSSSSNTTTTIDSVTLPSNNEIAAFSQCVWRQNAQAGGELATDGTEDIYISGFEVVIERKLEGRISTKFGNRVDEPIPQANDFPLMVSGKLKFPAIQDGTGGNKAFMAAQMALTAYKAKLIITSSTLAGAATQYFQHVLWFPYILFGDGKPGIDGAGGQTWEIPFEAHHVGTIPTGFTAGYTDAVTWEVFSQRAGDALA